MKNECIGVENEIQDHNCQGQWIGIKQEFFDCFSIRLIDSHVRIFMITSDRVLIALARVARLKMFKSCVPVRKKLHSK